MDLVLKYLENATRFRELAALEQKPDVRAELEKLASAYLKLAKDRAEQRHLPVPDEPHKGA